MPRDKMVRVSERELRLLREAKRALERRGYASIEEYLQDIEEVEERADLEELLAGLALGAIAAVGAIALIKLLTTPGQGGGFG